MAAQTTMQTPEVVASEADNPAQDFPKKTMSYEEFLAWADEDTHAEWVNGEVIIFMPPLNPHQTLIEFLHHFIGLYQSVPVGADGIYRSAVLPGFWLRVEWLWAEQPDVLRALAEVIGPERMAQALRQAMTAPDKDENL